jgi:predicted DNA binding CopG/RHH family protein
MPVKYGLLCWRQYCFWSKRTSRSSGQEDNVKVTLSLSRRSLGFFKREAKKRRVPHQRMIRALVDGYAERQAGGRGKM